MTRTILLYTALALSQSINAQNSARDTLVVFGTVQDMVKKTPIASMHVQAVDLNDRSHILHAASGDSGRYELNIIEERIYLITYSAPQFISKSIQIEVPGPTAEQWIGGYGMNVDINLVPVSSGHDPTLYKEPFGITRFNADSARYEWDLEYTKARAEAIRKATQ